MRFTTESGAKYDIFEVEGDQFIVRDCIVPIKNLYTSDDMDEVAATRVSFNEPPVVGERFHYLTRTHGGCVSTPVVSIEEEPDGDS